MPTSYAIPLPLAFDVVVSMSMSVLVVALEFATLMKNGVMTKTTQLRNDGRRIVSWYYCSRLMIAWVYYVVVAVRRRHYCSYCHPNDYLMLKLIQIDQRNFPNGHV